MSGLRVLKPGPQSLLQDAGRQGWQHLGVSPAGPLDWHGAAWANHLLNNPWGTPLLEIALGGVELRAEVDTWVAVCGAQVPLSLDDQPQPLWTRLPLRKGQQLRLGFARSGQRAYLAVAGGFIAAPLLGSVSVQLREGLGQAVQAGDLLACRPAHFSRGASVPWPYLPDYACKPLLRVITGGDAASFEEDQLQGFFAQTWQLSPHSDRMGARLFGEAVQPPVRQWSLGVGRGRFRCHRMVSRSSCRPITRAWVAIPCSVGCIHSIKAAWRNARRTIRCASPRSASATRRLSCASFTASFAVKAT